MFDRTPVPHTIARTLQEMIRSGELKADEKMPSQRVLSDRLKVSRASLREALLTLETLGLVRTLPARGTFVVGPRSPATGGAIGWRYDKEYTIQEVFQTRSMIEGELCRLAAARIGSAEVAALREATNEFERAWRARDLVAHVEADLRFHRLIADSCPNRMLRTLYGSIRELLTETQRQPIPNTATERMDASIAEHRAIIDTLKTQNPMAAKRAMEAHILNTAQCAGIVLA